MNNNPCYQCADRKLGCHGVCDKYKAWRKELERYNRRVREIRAAIRIADDDYHNRRNRRRLKV